MFFSVTSETGTDQDAGIQSGIKQRSLFSWSLYFQESVRCIEGKVITQPLKDWIEIRKLCFGTPSGGRKFSPKN